jgi:hypothetical protein
MLSILIRFFPIKSFLKKRKERIKRSDIKCQESLDYEKYLEDVIPFNEVVKAPPFLSVVPKKKVGLQIGSVRR